MKLITFAEFLTEGINSIDWVDAMNDTEKEAEEIVVKDWAEFTPKVCNSGFCDIFVDKITAKLQGTTIYSTEWSDGGTTHGHVWFKYKNKYYDAEIPNGVFQIEDIPYIKRVVSYQGEIPTDIEIIG